MNKLSEMFKKSVKKWKNQSKTRKIAFSIIFLGVLAAAIFAGVSLGKTKYEVLFSNMDSSDSAAVYSKLQEKKIDAKVQGNNILVPKDKVEQLRMEMLAQVPMTNGSQGFELLDKSKFGSTDTETKINYQRALQGELERTIKGFPQVEAARVHLVLPEDTAFVKDTQPGRASVTVKMKQGQKLSQEQVKAIVSLISGSVKNLSKENVEVIDDKMSLLTKDLNYGNSKSGEGMTSVEKQQELKSKYENELEKKLSTMFGEVYGSDKVKVRVSADLDFDAVQQDTTTYDPKASAVVSEHTIKENSGGNNSKPSASPVDNNMNNSVVNATNQNNGSSREEMTKNYGNSKVEQKTIKAPGAVKRLTTSVVVDGNIDEQTRNAIRNLTVTAINFDEKRGDSITVEGIPFDQATKKNAQDDLNAIKKAEEQAQKTKLYSLIGAGLALLLAAIVAFIIIRRRKAKDELEDQIEPHSIDVLIGNEGGITEAVPTFKPLNFEVENEKTHLENELKKYAKDKPEQVADIIKSWLAEDER